jgi:hypothetical protein
MLEEFESLGSFLFPLLEKSPLLGDSGFSLLLSRFDPPLLFHSLDLALMRLLPILFLAIADPLEISPLELFPAGYHGLLSLLLLPLIFYALLL